MAFILRPIAPIIDSMRPPVIAIIGRPNVGKSTLFNRLIGKHYAVTSKVPGTTRDRLFEETEIPGYRILLVDTGGLNFDISKEKNIESDVQLQARLAAEEADLIYFVIDTTEALTATDIDAAHFLRKSQKPILVIANKIDNQKTKTNPEELYKFGFGEAIQVSGIHNLGLPDLENETSKRLKKMKWKRTKEKATNGIHVAIVGKPNVGKSSLINALLGHERLIVSEIPGTTIDTTDSKIERSGQQFILIDTAGIRRRGKVRKGIEKYSTLRSLQAISRSDIACLIIDFAEGLSNQDLHVLQYILDAGKGLILLVNKTDLMEDTAAEQENFLDKLTMRIQFAPWAPVLFISANTKKNIWKIFDLALKIDAERKKKIPQKLFNVFLETTVLAHPPSHGGHVIVIKGGEQNGICPPAFTLESNRPDDIHFSYRRYIENEIRRKFGFQGTAIKLAFQSRLTRD